MFISTQLQHTNLKTTSCTTQVRKHLPENLQEVRAGVSCLRRHGNIRTWRCMLRVPAVWKGRAQSSQVPVGLSSLLSCSDLRRRPGKVQVRFLAAERWLWFPGKLASLEGMGEPFPSSSGP